MKINVVVIGGGHAGIEAANMVAKKGLTVLLVTSNIELIGQLSCNPSIGGIAKGNIVREIDSLGGLMGKITDEVGIQFRMLNKTKGLAVWGNRAQVDKSAYRLLSKKLLEKQQGIYFFQDFVTTIDVQYGKVCGVSTKSGQKISCDAVVVTTGTFLNGMIHIGMTQFCGGRLGEEASTLLSQSINALGIKSGRLKTGTSSRIDGKTVDFTKLKEQSGDVDPWPFSFTSNSQLKNIVSCWEFKTERITHDIIRDNIHKSPLYNGKISGVGPRYCPSIEDKVIRFGERNGHTLFLEPEGVNTSELYLNGFSTSLPFDVQKKMVNSLPGLEQAQLIRPGYAIEYDYFFPNQLLPTLESRIVEGLFFAGQINGTSGYEEAAAQGLVAGINAANKIQKQEPLILSRDCAYIGVLIDDLISKGTDEPYRMFTSRAEYRLLLRQDNSDERLMPLALKHGVLDRQIFENRQRVWEERKKIKEIICTSRIGPEKWNEGRSFDILSSKITAGDLIKRPSVSIFDIFRVLNLAQLDRYSMSTIEGDFKYEGFVQKQQRDVERLQRYEEVVIPEYFKYETIQGLLTESRIKLTKVKPITIGQASRISGVTPADITLLLLHLLK